MSAKQYSDEFIKKALVTWKRMAGEGKTNRQVAEHLGFHPSMLHYWSARAVGKGWDETGPSRMKRKTVGLERHGRLHSEEFKLRAVTAVFNRGDRTVREIADDLGVSHGLLYRWVHLSGMPNTKVGLLRSKQPAPKTTGRPGRFSEETKRRAVKAVRDDDRSWKEVIEEFGVGRTTLHKWLHEADPNFNRIDREAVRRGDVKRGELEQLQAERDRLRTEAAALRQTIVLLGRRT